MKKLTGIALLAIASGCQTVQRNKNSLPEAQAQSPLVVDEAMQLREWNRSTAVWANGDTLAGPTGFNYQTRWNQGKEEPDYIYVAEETPLFILQSVASPFVLIFTPPWTPILYKGATVESTYTAMPPVKGSGSASMSQ